MSLSNFITQSKLNFRVESFKNTNSTKSFREKLINSINKEVELLKVREDLTLRKIIKNVKGKSTKVNEVRFWSNNPIDTNSVRINLRHKNRIFDFNSQSNTTSEKEWIVVEKTKDNVINCLNTIKSQLEIMGDDNPLLTEPIVVKKDKEVESLNTTI